MTVHRFYVPPEQIESKQVRILGEDATQIRRVLRLEAGARLQVFDGSGRQVEARITEIGSSEVTAQPVETTYPQTETSRPVHLLQALLKGEKMDWVVEKATELGATSLILFPARRSVVQVREERAERKAGRWSRIAKEAAEQCGRVRVPEVTLAASLKDALAAKPESQLFIADEALAGPRLSSIDESENPRSLEDGIRVLVGPEGGWTPEERERAQSQDAQAISLGPRILRAETAALIALSRFTLRE